MRITRWVKACSRQQGRFVVSAYDIWPLGVGQAITTPGGTEGRILVRDTWGTEIVDALKPRPEDCIVYKHRYSGFYETELDSMLKAAGINQLIITGCTTSVCVESTIRDAYFRDYQSVPLSDGIDEPIGKSLPRSNHDASLMLVEMLFGWVTVSEQFLEACGRNRVRARGATIVAKG